jgi:hypothetical protein
VFVFLVFWKKIFPNKVIVKKGRHFSQRTRSKENSFSETTTSPIFLEKKGESNF